jgi:DNA-binding CsgD family transcriptional regulator
MNLDTSVFYDVSGAEELLGTATPSAELTTALLMRVLEEVNHGVVLVTVSAKVCYANWIARSTLWGTRLSAVDESSLNFANLRDQLIFLKALKACLGGKRSLLNLRSQAGNYLTLGVSPIDAVGSENPERAVAMLTIGKAQCADALGLQFFAQTHHLTLAESRVVGHLCEGMRATEIADQLGVACSTVRSQVRSVIQKTQAKGIRDVVSKVMLLPPMASACHSGAQG